MQCSQNHEGLHKVRYPQHVGVYHVKNVCFRVIPEATLMEIGRVKPQNGHTAFAHVGPFEDAQHMAGCFSCGQYG